MGRQKPGHALAWRRVGWQKRTEVVAGGCGSPSGEELATTPAQTASPRH